MVILALIILFASFIPNHFYNNTCDDFLWVNLKILLDEFNI
jgi:hypothetical protein